MLAKLLIGYAAAMFGLFIGAFMTVTVLDVYQRVGGTAATLTAMLMAALPAFLIGLWLKTK